MRNTRHLLNPYEKPTNILDPVLFKKKFDFFYDSSFDILFKREFKDKHNALNVFAESHKANSCDKEAEIHKHKPFLIKNSSQLQLHNKKHKHIRLVLSPKENAHHQTLTQINTPTPIPLPQYRPKQNKHTNITVPNKPYLHRSQSQNIIEPNYVLKFSKTISNLDKMINHLDKIIKKEKNKEYFSVLKESSFKDERSKVLSLFIDYLDPDLLEKIKYRYNDLFGKDSYIRHIKTLKQKAEKAKKLKSNHNRNHSAKEIEKPQYINMLHYTNDTYMPYSNNTKHLVNNKYSSLGRVRVLNLPKEISELESEFNDRWINKNNVLSDNARHIYYYPNTKTQRQYDHCTKLSKAPNGHYRGIRRVKTTKESHRINSLSKDLEKDTNRIKKNIINIKMGFNTNVPLMNKKVIAFIENSEKTVKDKPIQY